MAQPLDIDAYLARINYTGPRTPTYDTLAGILRAHTASIPFESFDVLLGRPIRLDPEGLQSQDRHRPPRRLLLQHASLMHAALEAIGFAPVRHASRVLLFEPRHESVRQHMFLTVTIGGTTYVIDPGFRAPSPARSLSPVRRHSRPDERTHPSPRPRRQRLVLYVTRDGEQIQGWISTMEEEYPVDFEMMNHYIATHPASFFTHNILASAVTQEGRINIMNQTSTSSATVRPNPLSWRTAKPCARS